MQDYFKLKKSHLTFTSYFEKASKRSKNSSVSQDRSCSPMKAPKNIRFGPIKSPIQTKNEIDRVVQVLSRKPICKTFFPTPKNLQNEREKKAPNAPVFTASTPKYEQGYLKKGVSRLFADFERYKKKSQTRYKANSNFFKCFSNRAHVFPTMEPLATDHSKNRFQKCTTEAVENKAKENMPSQERKHSKPLFKLSAFSNSIMLAKTKVDIKLNSKCQKIKNKPFFSRNASLICLKGASRTAEPSVKDSEVPDRYFIKQKVLMNNPKNRKAVGMFERSKRQKESTSFDRQSNFRCSLEKGIQVNRKEVGKLIPNTGVSSRKSSKRIVISIPKVLTLTQQRESMSANTKNEESVLRTSAQNRDLKSSSSIKLSENKQSNRSVMNRTSKENITVEIAGFDVTNFIPRVQGLNTVLSKIKEQASLSKQRAHNPKVPILTLTRENIDLNKIEIRPLSTCQPLLPVNEGDKESLTSSMILSEMAKYSARTESKHRIFKQQIASIVNELRKLRVLENTQNRVSKRIKRAIFQWILEVCAELELTRITAVTTIQNFNKLVSVCSFEIDKLQFEALTILSLAAKMEETKYLALDQFAKTMESVCTASDISDNQVTVFNKLGCSFEVTTVLNLLMVVQSFWDVWLPLSGFNGDAEMFCFHSTGKQSYANFRVSMLFLEEFLVNFEGPIEFDWLLFQLIKRSFSPTSDTQSREITKYLKVFIFHVISEALSEPVKEAVTPSEINDREIDLCFMFDRVDTTFEAPSNESCKTYQEYLLLQTYESKGKDLIE